MNTNHDQHTLVPYHVYVLVWAVLVMLTGLTVGAYLADMGHVAILTAIIIATIKVSLVMLYFMHLRYANPIMIGMVLFVLLNYMLFMSLTFVDYFAR